jgi:hypothetical protein
VINVFTNFKVERKPATAYLAKIRRLPSCVSWQTPCEPHHLTGGPAALERGIGLKATDKWAVPLTSGEHRFDNNAVHSVGSREELNWFLKRGVNPYRLAEELWANRDDFEAMHRVMKRLHENGGNNVV